MKARQQRMIFIGLVVAGMAVSAGFAYRAFNENLLYYFSPTQVAEGDAPLERRFRLGGLVVDGSVKRASGSLTVDFVVTDNYHSIPVQHTGVLPDLFTEGQGVVTHGTMNADGLFVADEVLAKHDENYMAPEVAESLEEGARRAAEAE
ncbi:MAG TPA: cytochrome c maturation protein CcmE [Gammaproteobacteria bacterium]|nr:cytochrome c maturation protein CcmE [Gammaproteobacteria bacterium]